MCIQDKRINNTRITPELIHIPEWDLGPEDLMQIDLLPELPPSGGYENIITAIDVILRYAFAYPVSDPTAVNTAKVIIDIMTQYDNTNNCHLPANFPYNIQPPRQLC